MTTNTYIAGGGQATVDLFKNGSIFYGFQQAFGGDNAEVNYQRKFTAGTLSNVGVRVTSSTTGANATSWASRKNTAAGNQTISLASSVTGFLVDVTHTDSLANGDVANPVFIGTSAAPDCFVTVHGAKFNATSPIHEHTFSSKNIDTSISGLTTEYFPLSGSTTITTPGVTTENGQVRTLLRSAGTLKNLQSYIVSNSVLTTATISSRKNAGAGNQALSISTLATGYFQDTTHTDSVANGDDADYSMATGAAANSIVLSYIGVSNASTTSAQDLVSSLASGSSLWQQATVSIGIGCQFGETATEINSRAGIKYAGTWSRLRLNINTNSESNSTTFRARNGGSTGNQTISIGAGVTGTLEDTTHTDSIGSGNTGINYGFLGGGGTGSIVPNWTASLYDDGSNTGSSTETGTAVMSFGGIAFVASATDKHTGTAVMSFGSLVINAAGTDSHAGSAILSFGGVAFAASATDTHAGSALLSFSGLAINATGTDRHTGTAVLAFSGLGLNAIGHDYLPGGAAILSFSGLGINATGTDSHTAAAVLAFGGLAINALAAFVETGTAILSFEGVSIIAVGDVRHTTVATGVLHFGGIAIVAQGLDPGAAGSGVRQFWTF